MPGVCPRCLREVYFAEEKLALGKVWHTFCFSCRNCRKLLDSCTVATHCGELFCRNCCTRLFAPSVQPPLPTPALDLTSSRREVPFSSSVRRPTSDCDSFSDCYCCCCCQEDCSIGEIPSERTREARLEKHRLRGGGGEEEEPEDFRLAEETRRCSESECSNLGVVSSTTTLCNVPSSPTAVTTWYNRQHSASQSTFGGQSCAKNPLGQGSSNNPTSGNVTKHFCNNNNNDRCSNIGGSYDNGRYKCSKNRRTDNPCCPSLQQNQQSSQEEQIQEQEQEQDPKPHHQQQVHPEELQERQTQKLLKQKKQKREISEPQLQEQQENLRLELREQQLKKKFHSNDLIVNEDSKINSNRYQSSLDRFSRTSDIPEETSSSASGLTFPSKMPIDGNTGCQNNAGGPTASENNPNNYSSSGQSCCGTHYETCYEMDEPNTGTIDYRRPSDLQIEEIRNKDEDTRLRGGCGGCGSRGGCATTSGAASCPPRDECPREPTTSCGTPSCDPPCGNRGGCCAPAGCRPVCRKPGRSCCPPCVAEPQGCGGGGCCGGGCRGGCGKPGRLCMPLRPCSAPPCQPQVCRPRGSPCTPPRCCGPMPPCCKPPGIMTRPPSCAIGGGASCCRSKSPRRGCCSAPQDDAGCGYCGPRLPPGCECLGGGLDCQRCGCKVYQAEMQIASGVPYHNICFSCFCCRKPLEPLTYQENCGEIYCKHCYVRNFGPQGYGYGAGAGVLQTPM